MSTLTLVRHGQSAVDGAAALTALGEAQAAMLGRYWATKGVRFDEVHTGCLARQVRTEQVVADCYREASLPWPTAVPDPAWNEYSPGTAVQIPPRTGADEYRRLQRMFEAAMVEWLEAVEPPDGAEPAAAFRERVSGAIGRVMAGPSGRRVAVFTSGGPIGLCVQVAMQAPERSFLEVNWRVRNCSVTEFLFDHQRLTLDSFNSVAHLDDAALRTFR